MAPLIEVSEKTLKEIKQLNFPYRELQFSEFSFIYVPPLNLDILKQRTHFGENWYQTQEGSGKENSTMLVIPSFIELLKYARKNDSDFYKELTEVREPWRGEWLNAYFENRNNEMYILTKNRTIAEKLDEDTLMEDKKIDFDSWLSDPTKQGLPKKDIKEGSLCYFYPRDSAVAWFYSSSNGNGFCCQGYPQIITSWLGIHPAKPHLE